MTPQAQRNYVIARYIAGAGIALAVVLVAFSIIANRNATSENKHAISANHQAIQAIKDERTVRIQQINDAVGKLCEFARDNRILQRQSIIDGPEVLRARWSIAGISRARLALIVGEAEHRRDTLLRKYAPIECPRSFVQN